ncbi:MAG: DUF459 domain-containing protein [Acidimicrobiia bacterium]
MADFDPQNPFLRQSENTDPRRSALFASNDSHHHAVDTSSQVDRDRKKDSRPLISARRELRLKHSKIRRNVLIAVSIVIGLLLALIATDTIKLGTGQRPYFSNSQSSTNIQSNPVKVEGETIEALRELTPEKPLRVYIAGDSLVGSYGNFLSKTLGDTGVVKATWDSRPSSGLVNENFFNWPKHLKQMMSKYNPEIVVFMIGTNDASIASSNPTNYEKNYEKKLNEVLKIINLQSRKAVFVLPPAMKDSKLNSNVQKINRVIKNVIAENKGYLFDSNNVLSPQLKFQKSLLVSKKSVTIRTDDGIHITGAGGELLGKKLFSFLDKSFFIERFSDGKPIKPSKVSGCCTSYKTASTTDNLNSSSTSTFQSNSSTTSTEPSDISTTTTTQNTTESLLSE